MTYFCSKTPQIHVFVTKHKMRKNGHCFSKQENYTFLMKTKKRMREMMVRVSTRIPQNSPVLALLQSRLYLLDSLSQSGGSLHIISYSIETVLFIFSPVHRSLSSPQDSLLPGDLFPHDVEDGGADEAVLYGAGKQERGTALQQLVQRLQMKIDPQFAKISFLD